MSGVIDGAHWLRQRIQYLEELLRGELSAAQRAQLEAELEQARAELRRERRRRWLWWRRPV